MEKRTIWLRLGVTVELDNEDDERKLLTPTYDAQDFVDTLTKLIDAGKFTLDGESYIPAMAIEVYNREYRTNYADNEDQSGEL